VPPEEKPAQAPVQPAATSESSFVPPTKAQLNRLRDLATFADSQPKCGKVAKTLWKAIDDDEIGQLTQGAAGALIGKAKATLEPLGWEPEPEQTELPTCNHPSFVDGSCTECGLAIGEVV
jgi:hypothetical protein